MGGSDDGEAEGGGSGTTAGADGEDATGMEATSTKTKKRRRAKGCSREAAVPWIHGHNAGIHLVQCHAVQRKGSRALRRFCPVRLYRADRFVGRRGRFCKHHFARRRAAHQVCLSALRRIRATPAYEPY